MLIKDEIIKQLTTYFQDKKDLYDIDMAFLYGSWACGNPMKESDVDVAVIFKNDMCEDEICERVDKITIELTVQLKKEINILNIDHELSHPMLHYNAIIHGISVLIRDFTRYVNIRFKAISQMEDFSIFGTKWQSDIVKRRMEVLSHG